MEGPARLTVVVSNDGVIDGPLPALIPPGEYQLGLSYWTTYKLFGRAPKLTLWFKVLDMGPQFGALLPRHYNVKALVGQAGRHGRFKAAAGCDLVRDYARLLALPARFDRFDLQCLKARVAVGRVETVKTTARQQELAPAVRYSVVRELLRLEA